MGLYLRLGFVLSHMEMVAFRGFAVISLCVDVVEFLVVFVLRLGYGSSDKSKKLTATLAALSKDLIYKTSDTSLQQIVSFPKLKLLQEHLGCQND